ncbi:tyrosine-type recombinase/integrase [Nocardia asteroides]|uniref:tyrosine-type recombinase/integrase n=1 Tax=Nocardia asteroides TaxID=1824 RepID=UPI001E3F69EB|nr:site-specific integrase [Nocardia asteroides]UGT61853.1 site-specific integrase [Nocardia asteroides]
MARGDDIGTALHLIARLGLTLEDLAVAEPDASKIPTFQAYLAGLRDAVPVTTLRAYNSYWRIIEREWGERRLDEPSATEITAMVEAHRHRAVVRRNTRGGHNAVLLFIAAFRCLYRHAERDKLVHPLDNPAARVDKPAPLASPRHALSRDRIEDLARIASTTGNDPDLDALLVRLHVETACRRGGSLALRGEDLDPEDCLIRLREKRNTVRWQPVSPTLMRDLLLHVEDRGGLDSTRPVLRYYTGAAMGRRRYDHLADRWREHLPWAATPGVSMHWLRHTTLTWVEREFGYATARAYAGHADSRGRDGVTHTYVRAGVTEVAAAVQALTGEPHPLAAPGSRGSGFGSA